MLMASAGMILPRDLLQLTIQNKWLTRLPLVLAVAWVKPVKNSWIKAPAVFTPLLMPNQVKSSPRPPSFLFVKQKTVNTSRAPTKTVTFMMPVIPTHWPVHLMPFLPPSIAITRARPKRFFQPLHQPSAQTMWMVWLLLQPCTQAHGAVKSCFTMLMPMAAWILKNPNVLLLATVRYWSAMAQMCICIQTICLAPIILGMTLPPMALKTPMNGAMAY